MARAVVQPMYIDGRCLSVGSLRPRASIGYGSSATPKLLGAQAQVEWNGMRYSIEGEPRIYNSSRRTAHVDYVMMR